MKTGWIATVKKVTYLKKNGLLLATLYGMCFSNDSLFSIENGQQSHEIIKVQLNYKPEK